MMELKGPAQGYEQEHTTLAPQNIVPSSEEVNRLLQDRRERVFHRLIPTPTSPTSSTDLPSAASSPPPPEPWKQVQPWTSALPGKPYPIGSLPEVVRDAVQEVREYTQAPIALAANSALVCLATACQAIFDVERDGNLRSPTSLYFLTLAESGERKTTCDKFFSSVIASYQIGTAKEYAPEVKRYRSSLAAWEAKLDGLKLAIKNSTQEKKGGRDIGVLQSELEEHYQNKPESPRVPNIIRTDDTPENLAFVLAHHWPSVGIISSEGGLDFASRALQKESLVGTLAMYNCFWDGGEWQIGRKGDGSYTVRGARLSIGLQVQPQVMATFSENSNDIIRSIGFLARCLFSCPESTQGSRLYRPAPETMAKVNLFNQVVLRILNSPYV